MARLQVTVQQARSLFHNLQQDVRGVCEKEFKELEDPNTSIERKKDFEALWEVVDREMRIVYEMSRYGLDVTDLAEDTTSVEVFRGYCEDVDGVEPRDASLIESIAKETQAIQESLEQNALYRSSIPAKVEAHFMAHVEEKRKLFDELSRPPPSSTSVAPDMGLPAPDLLGTAMTELKQRLETSKSLLNTVLDS